MIRFTKENWDRFFSKNKKSTIRTHQIKIGDHNAYAGSRFKPIFLGKVKISMIEKSCKLNELTEQDAIDDGFDRKSELLAELWMGELNEQHNNKIRLS